MSKQGHDFRWRPPDENGSKTPSWKERYRQRCMERLRENRFKHLLAKRQSDSLKEKDIETNIDERINQQTVKDQVFRDIQNMMKTEWDHVQREDAADKGITPDNIPAPSLDEMIAFMDSLLEELQLEKLRETSEEYLCDEYVKKEEEELCSAFHRLNAVEVICPICQKNCLEEVTGTISCKCGLKIDTEQDCISLKNVAENLELGTAEHGEQCEHTPSFSQSDNFGISTLIMTCQECDFNFIIV